MSWRTFQDQLSDEIRAGLLAPGDALPTQGERAPRFDASRHAVRRALEALADAGLVASWRGKRCSVPERKSPRVATVAMANKTARIIWAVLTRNERYRPRIA